MDSIRAQKITDIIKAGEESTPSTQGVQTGPVKIRGKYEKLPIYIIPIKYLRFNLDNGRFFAEKLKLEERTGIELDPDNPDHEKYFLKLLLNKDDKDTDTTLEEIKKYGQRDPGVITFDGYVINGNRRMAALKKLHQEGPKPEYEFLKVHRLPKAFDVKELYRLELDLQIKKGIKKRYGPVNEALKIKEGIDKGFTTEEIKDGTEWSFKKIEDAIDRVDYYDVFLANFKRPGDYALLAGYNEHIVEMMKGIRKLEIEGKTALEIQNYMNIFFKGLEVNFDDDFEESLPHRGPLRNLKDAFLDDDLKEDLEDLIDPSKTFTTQDVYETIVNVSNNYESIKLNKKPVKILKNVLVLLRKIDENNEAIKEEEFTNKINEVEARLNVFKEKIIE